MGSLPPQVDVQQSVGVWAAGWEIWWIKWSRAVTPQILWYLCSISCTCVTYCFHDLPFHIQSRLAVESAQQVALGFWRQFLKSVLTSGVKINPPNNSSLGINCFFTGASLVLDTINLVITLPPLLIVCKYNTAAYACFDTSLNPCSSIQQESHPCQNSSCVSESDSKL